MKQKSMNLTPIIVALVLFAVIFLAVAVLMVTTLKRANTPPVQEPTVQSEPVEQPADVPEEPFVIENNLPDEPEAPQEVPEMPDEPPVETGRIQLGNLSLTLDETQFSLRQDGELYTVMPKNGEELPRLDLQRVEGSMAGLSGPVMKRIAVGLLQAYYYVPPKTADITVTALEELQTSYRAELSAPAADDVPAMQAVVRLLDDGDALWYAIVLYPAGTDAEALITVLDSAED